MTSHQKTIIVEHEGAHQATDEQIKDALTTAVKDEDYRLAGGYTVQGYENESGKETKFTLRFDTEPKAARVKDTDGKEIAPDADGVVTVKKRA